MPSFNNPKVTNPISPDVSEIRELLKIVAKQDYTGATDLPEGAKRLAAVRGGTQLQKYANSSWTSIGKLMHDVDTVDGAHASKTVTTEGYIPIYGTGGLIAGGCKGNAGTATKLKTAIKIDIAGIASATEQSFDGSKSITIPINSINVANEDDNALVGIVSKAHGGTGRNDGAASDVILANGGKASQYGQIGNAINLTGKNLNSLIVDGNYVGGGDSKTVEMGYPIATSATAVLNVYSVGSIIHQFLSFNSDQYWHRYSANKGASWNGWVCVGASSTISSRVVYVSKSGSDTNTGLDKEHPVLTINRGIQILSALSSNIPSPVSRLCIGEGEWGSVTFRPLGYALEIYPYDNVAATSYSESLPKFDTISFLGATYAVVRGVVAKYFDANGGAFVDIGNAFLRVGQMRSRYNSMIDMFSTSLEIMNIGTNVDPIRTYHGGKIVVGADSTCKVVENITVDKAFLYMTSCSEIYNLEAISFSLASGVSVTGQRYKLTSGASVRYCPKSHLDTIPGSIAGRLSVCTVNNVPYGGGAADEALMADLSWKPVLLRSGGTITGELIIKPENNRFGVVNGLVTKGTNPSATQYWQVQFADKSGLSSGNTRLGCLETKLGADGTVQTGISAYQNKEASTDRSTIAVYRKTDGTGYATAPTPPDSSSSTEILTAQWYNKKIAAYMPKTGGTFTGSVKGQTVAKNSNSTDFATTAWVRAATGTTNLTAANATKWNGAGKTISTAMPSGGNDGDLWFRY